MLSSLFVLAAACGDDEGGDEITAIPFPTTIELSAEDLASLESAGDDGTLVFDPAPASLADVEVGRIRVGGVSDETPAGLLRAVLAVERDGDRLTLGTAVAPIQLAYRKLHVKLAKRSSAVVGAAARRAALPAEGVGGTKPCAGHSRGFVAISAVSGPGFSARTKIQAPCVSPGPVGVKA